MCGYDLSATTSTGHNRCPECGWGFDPQLLLAGTYQREREERPLYIFLAVIMFVFFVSILVLSITA
jgi:hypothetical protein